jgi:hypothetical protein
VRAIEKLRTLGSQLERLAAGYLAHPMTRHAPLRIALNIVGWQLRGRIQPGDHDQPWIAGARLLVRRGMIGATGNI